MQLLHSSLLSLATHLESGKRIGQAELQDEGEGPCSVHTLAMHGSSKKREGEGAEREAQRGSGRGGEREGVVWTDVCVCVCLLTSPVREGSRHLARGPFYPPYHVRSFNVPFPTRLRPGAAKRWTNEITRVVSACSIYSTMNVCA